MKSVLNIHWKDWCWSWNSNTLGTWCEGLTHLKKPWCWERLNAGGEGDDKGWDVWMASLTRWTWVWVNSGSWRWTGRPGMLQFMWSQRVGLSDWTELTGHTKTTLGLQFAASDKIVCLLSAVHTSLQNYTYTNLLRLGSKWFKLLPECTIKYSFLFWESLVKCIWKVILTGPKDHLSKPHLS